MAVDLQCRVQGEPGEPTSTRTGGKLRRGWVAAVTTAFQGG
jgi:hypothetical protein